MAEIVINDIEPRNAYTAAGGETGFDYDFPIFDEDDLVVLQITDAGVLSTLTIVTHYTVSGVGNAAGGSITLDITAYPSGAPADYRYVLYRDLAIARATDFLTGGDFKASTMNRELDKIIMMLQQNELQIKRSLALQKADAEDEILFDVETAAARANKVLVFGENGNTVKGAALASVGSTLDATFGTLAANDFIVHNGTAFVNKTLAETKTILGLKQNNYTATAAPTVNDDSDNGYSIGSQWYDGTNDNMYHCMDATVGAAVWVQGDIVAADLGSAAVAALVDDDTFATATASNVPSAESVKAYVDNNSGGKVVQRVYAEDASMTSGTAQIPFDDTIPQNTEGLEAITASITPTNASNRLRIRAKVNVANTGSNQAFAAALFQDSTANALQVATAFESIGNGTVTIFLEYEMAAGTTSSTTFKIRAAGENSVTVTLNGVSGARLFGGAMKHTMVIEEIEP